MTDLPAEFGWLTKDDDNDVVNALSTNPSMVPPDNPYDSSQYSAAAAALDVFGEFEAFDQTSVMPPSPPPESPHDDSLLMSSNLMINPNLMTIPSSAIKEDVDFATTTYEACNIVIPTLSDYLYNDDIKTNDDPGANAKSLFLFFQLNNEPFLYNRNTA